MTDQIQAQVGKSPLKSKTNWVAFLSLIIATLAFVAGDEWIVEYPKVVAAILMVREMLNFVLRAMTNQPLNPISNMKGKEG